MNNLDPRTKMMIIIFISAAALLTDKIFFLTGLLIFTALLMWAMGVSLKQQKKQLTATMGIVIFLFALQAIFGNFYLGAVLSIRLLIIMMSALILLTGHPRDYLLALIQCRMPYELAYMVILAFHFFPLLREEAMDIYYSIQLRGTELQKTSLRKKISAYRKMCIPILAGAMERARDTSVAMEVRGFRAYRERTYMRKLSLKKKDIALIIAIPLLAVAFIVGARIYDGDSLSGGITGYQTILSETDGNAITVSWTDDEKYDGILDWDGNEIRGDVTEIKEGEYYRYTAETGDLDGGETYSYRVGDGTNMSNKGRFEYDKEDKDFAFLYLGDIQYQLRDRDYEMWGEFMKAAYEENDDVSFAVFGGDMVEKGPDVKDWEAFFTNAEPVFSRIPMMTTVGNHETSMTPITYLKMMALPENSPLPEEFYSFDYGSCHFVSLNSCLFMGERKSQPTYEQDVNAVNKWLENDLSSDKTKWKIVYMHHPMYPLSEDDEMYGEMRDNWEDILIDGGVDMVLCGHQHAYMRTKPIGGIVYMMANSGQKPSNYIEGDTVLPGYVKSFSGEYPNYVRIDVKEDSLIINSFSREGEQIDSCEIRK